MSLPFPSRRATIAIETLFCLPPFVFLVALAVQVADMASTALVVRHAAFAAARSFAVEGDARMAHRAAAFVLQSTSPSAASRGSGGRARTRFDDADAHTSVAFTPGELPSRPSDVTARVAYRMRLVIPGAARLLGRDAGSDGYVFDLAHSVTLRSTGRRSRSPMEVAAWHAR